MQSRNLLTKLLAILGLVLVWAPVVAPVAFTILHWARARRFALDYLMPAELFLSVLAGGALLVWASVRARSRRAWIGGALGMAAALLVGGQALAVVSGLASGERPPVGLAWAVVLGALVLYDAAVVAIGIGGALLLRDVFRAQSPLTA
jgi:hypothetical protein